jgi:hypothetical protein
MGKDASTIQQEINETRGRIGDTVEALGYKTDVGARLKDTVRGRVETLRESVGEAVETVKSSIDGASEAFGATVNDRVAAAGPRINSTVATVSDRVAGANDALGQKMRNADVGAQAQRALGFAQANPIGLALAALAVGFLAGSLVPVSDIERERLGPIRDRVVDQAQAATHDLVEAGKAVVAETAQSVVATAMSSAQSHGHDVVEAAKSRAGESTT